MTGEELDDAIGTDPGQCRDCAHALVRPTNRGTVYLRCGAAGTVPGLERYPRLPVTGCPGYQVTNG